jgi:hypothetical protein
LQTEYQTDYEAYFNKSEEWQNELDQLMRVGTPPNYSKRVPPFKMFKRDMAVMTEKEYPNMTKGERSVIIKE